MSTPTKTHTRTRLMDAAAELINRQGFAATSIDQILEQVGLTKGTFFYHFKSKADLARALIERFAEQDRQLLEASMQRVEKLTDDPLQQLMVFAGLMVEVAEQLDASPQPGCLFATYCYESGLFDADTNGVISEALLRWQRMLGDKLRAAAATYPPRVEVELDSLADMISVVFEGAFITARTLGGNSVIADQMRHFRTYLQLLFSPPG